jgi:diguanylate cyclase (GGDEF)-like protein/PAS domain S-box-containing protein
MAKIRIPSPIGWLRLTLLSSVRWRIITGFGLLILFLVAIAAGSAWLERQHQHALAEGEHQSMIVALLQDTKERESSAAVLLQLYVASEDATAVSEIRSNQSANQESLSEVRAEEEKRGHEGDVAKASQLMARAAMATESAEQIIALRQSGDVQGASEAIAAAAPQMRRASAELEQSISQETQEAATLLSRAERAGDLAFWLLVAAGVIGAILGLAVSVLIGRSILRPLSSLETAALAVAGGDLGARAAVTGPRELAHLGAALKLMTESLLDASGRRQLEAELRRSEKRFRLLVNQAADAIFVADREGRFIDVNQAACDSLGYSRDEFLTLSVADIADGFSPDMLAETFKSVSGGVPITVAGDHRRKDGTTFPVEIRIGLVDFGDRQHMLGLARDITERKRAEEALRELNQELTDEHRQIGALNRSLENKVKKRTAALRLANEELRERNRQLLDARTEAATDGLTGLGNHRAFQERVRQEVSQAQANGGSLSIIMMDIDDFKRVNDSLGHQAGDKILRLLAQILTDMVRWESVYRYGGDEFAVLLPGTDSHKAVRLAERLRHAVAKRMGGNGTKVTVSLGIADFPHTADSAEQLTYGADAAMYWAKSAGKNRVGDWAKLLKRRTDGTLPWYAADRGVRVPDVVAALVAALAAKDPVTAAHTVRCSWYTAKLADELGLGEEEASIVRLASLLHDIGKLAVPDEVLFKPGSLNEDEWTQMKQHPTAALHVLDQIRSIADATPAILHHHEHFDGSGYPDGLAGDDIPLASRILLVTDAFDAMTTDRPYRKAMPVEAATEELKRNSGSQFDPVVVEAFLRILARDGAQPLRSALSAAKRTAATVHTG